MNDRTGLAADQRGVALLLVLLTTALIAAVAASLIVTASTETMIVGTARAGEEALYAAEAGLARAISELAALPDWTVVLSSSQVASFDDGAGGAGTPDGRSLSMAGLLTERQSTSNVTAGPGVFGADSPRWRLFGHAPLRSILPAGLAAPPAYVVVFVADDGLDGDGNPGGDANGRLLVYADGYGVAGARRGVQAVIGRAAPGAVRVFGWQQAR